MDTIELTKRQGQILEIVREEGPITGEHIADKLGLTRATLRPDLAILTMAGFLEARPRVGYFYAGKKSGQIFGEQLRKLKVKQYKSVPVVINDDASVYDAIVTMFMEDVGSIFVVKEGGILSGVISRKDLLKVAIGNQDTHKVPVSLTMTRMPNIVTLSPDDSVYEAAKRLIDYAIDSVPVVRPLDESGKNLEVVGRFTKTTIAKIFVELGEIKDV
ncbi:helix-turn-helix transcriptional regulator [Tumebacillus lipolyticus]|uniref:Helix-turn-helix transcriptional regulator n=1 Tax=Tumebacillus lipolyticus TaxID=1280370 RepID=A0ABW4ZYP8_9BACL